MEIDKYGSGSVDLLPHYLKICSFEVRAHIKFVVERRGRPAVIADRE